MKYYEIECKSCGERYTLPETDFSPRKFRCPFCRSKDYVVVTVKNDESCEDE